jgi:soluble lytic murein transglycosylase-like protein
VTPFEYLQVYRALPPLIGQWARKIAGEALACDVDPLVLTAIMAQESQGKDPAVLGFDGHGHGLMQIDDRAHPTFCEARWGKSTIRLVHLPVMNIAYAAMLHSENSRILKNDLWPTVAAFNAGPFTVKKALSRLRAGAVEAERFAAANSVTYKGEYVTHVRKYFENFTAAIAAYRRTNPPKEMPNV